ncbi:hypothetical protein RI129_007780 [Pyrocoelia pectoralis]|uniref:Uncharacterized protein n=1 Tax=Pyrocoelia pectoralis TaxID=417401 RepID=A0AAN7V8T0_9COLE
MCVYEHITIKGNPPAKGLECLLELQSTCGIAHDTSNGRRNTRGNPMQLVYNQETGNLGKFTKEDKSNEALSNNETLSRMVCEADPMCKDCEEEEEYTASLQ